MEIMEFVESIHKEIDYDKHKNCAVKYPTANDCIDCCSKPYFDNVSIDYTCSQKRKIYVARYAPAYISEIYSALLKTPEDYIEELSKKSEIKVASIGGGPGTDIAAFKKWLSNEIPKSHKINMVRFLRIDIHEDWKDISRAVTKLYPRSDIFCSYERITQDVTRQSICDDDFDSFDVIMLSYVISEIDRKDIQAVAKHISDAISDKALIIINDRRQNEVIAKIDELIAAIGKGALRVVQPMDKEHCGETYPSEIFDKVGPTIFRKSIRYNFLVG